MAFKNPETRRAYERSLYRLHREARLARAKLYAATFPEKRRALRHKYYEEHREEETAQARAWQAVHPDRTQNNVRAYAAAHKETIALRRKIFKKTYPERYRQYQHRRRARKSTGLSTANVAHEKAIKAAYKYRCAYCGTKPKKLTIDHVIALSRGGGHIPENLAPACGPCNSRKKDHDAPTLPAVRLLL